MIFLKTINDKQVSTIREIKADAYRTLRHFFYEEDFSEDFSNLEETVDKTLRERLDNALDYVEHCYSCNHKTIAEKFIKAREYNKKLKADEWSKKVIPNLIISAFCYYDSDKNSAICYATNDDMYIMNNDGKTIEKI